MKLHLPKGLFVAIATAMGTTYADYTPLDTPQEGANGLVWTWANAEWTKADGTKSNPAGVRNGWDYQGHYMILQEDKSGGVEFGDTSDGGGIKVINAAQVSDVSLGTYAGSIYVGEGAYLDAYGANLKNTEADGAANVWVEGQLNLRSWGNSLSWDGSKNQYWHIGKEGIVNLANASSIASNNKTWNIELILNREGGKVIENAVNRTMTTVTKTRTFLTAKGDLSGSLNSLTVLDPSNNALTANTDYRVAHSGNNLAVEYDVQDYATMDLTWTGNGSSDWTELGTNWADGNGTATSFMNGDNVTFGTEASSKTVNIGADITTGTVTVNDNYSFNVTADSSLQTSGITIAANKALTVTGGSTLTVSGQINGDVVVNGANLSISGENAFNGTSLSIVNGMVTADYESANGTGVISHNATVSIGAGGTLKLTGHDMQGWYASSAPAKIIVGSDDSTKVATLDIQDNEIHTGTAPIEMNGNAVVTGGDYSTFNHPTAASALPSTISVTNKNNKITLKTLQMRNKLNVDVATGGELTIESKITTHGDAGAYSGDMTKTGAGNLIITHTGNTWARTMEVQEGTLTLQGAAQLLTTTTMAKDTKLVTGTGKLGNLTMASGSTLEADSTVVFDATVNDQQQRLYGTLSLATGITLAGDMLSSVLAMQSETDSVTLFSGVSALTLDGAAYEGTVDFATIFTGEGITANTYLMNYSDGNVTISLSATPAVPEPTTATLSLLALAGLVMRRRRK